jgi:hypothetical protein
VFHIPIDLPFIIALRWFKKSKKIKAGIDLFKIHCYGRPGQMSGIDVGEGSTRVLLCNSL